MYFCMYLEANFCLAQKKERWRYSKADTRPEGSENSLKAHNTLLSQHAAHRAPTPATLRVQSQWPGNHGSTGKAGAGKASRDVGRQGVHEQWTCPGPLSRNRRPREIALPFSMDKIPAKCLTWMQSSTCPFDLPVFFFLPLQLIRRLFVRLMVS